MSQPANLAKQIGDFGLLVGLLLTLVTLLTANRKGALDAIQAAPNISARARKTELWLDATLVLLTTLVWLSGLSLAVRAVRHLHPLAEGGGLRSVFAVTWVVLLGLIGWQLSLFRQVLAVTPTAD